MRGKIPPQVDAARPVLNGGAEAPPLKAAANQANTWATIVARREKEKTAKERGSAKAITTAATTEAKDQREQRKERLGQSSEESSRLPYYGPWKQKGIRGSLDYGKK